MRNPSSTFKINPTQTIQWLMLICIFISVQNVYHMYYVLFASFVLFLLLPNLKIRINASSICLLLLGVAMLIFDTLSQSSLMAMLRQFVWFCAYTLGLCFISANNTYEQKENRVKLVLGVLGTGTFLHYILNMIINFGSETRRARDFWSGEYTSATAQACLACIALSIFIAVIFTDAKRVWKILSIVGMAIIMIYNVGVLAGRTLLFITPFLFVFAFIHQSYNKRINPFRKLFVIAFIILVIIALYYLNVFGIKDAFEESNFYYRFFEVEGRSVFADTRVSKKLRYLHYMLNFPWGGSKLKEVVPGYAHDLYLDTYNLGGVFALIGVGVYSFLALFRAFRVFRNKKISFGVKQVLLCIYLSTNVMFFLEPILQGVPWLFASYCIIDGLATCLLTSARSEQHKERYKNRISIRKPDTENIKIGKGEKNED